MSVPPVMSVTRTPEVRVEQMRSGPEAVAGGTVIADARRTVIVSALGMAALVTLPPLPAAQVAA